MGAHQRIILFADNPHENQLILKHLQGDPAHHVIPESLSAENLREQLEEKPNLIIFLDQPDKYDTCIELISALRAMKSPVPVLHLIQEDHYRLRVQSLRMGSDDVLSVPFALEELDARIHALLRRSAMGTNHLDGAIIRHGDLVLNTDNREVSRAGMTEKLTVKEYDLMMLFLKSPNQAIARKTILHSVWGQSWTGDDNLLEVYIRYLRKKIERPGHDKLLQTVRGVGYMLK